MNSLRRLGQLGTSLPADFAATVQMDAQVLTGIASEIERNEVSNAAVHLEERRAVWEGDVKAFRKPLIVNKAATCAGLLPFRWGIH